MQHVHLDPKFFKCLAALRKAGKKGDIAAQKADEIIERLSRQGFVMPAEIGTVTKYGELRLKHCIKYDLGNGYRLITIKQGRDLFVLYVGTHDECHRWVENNRELRLELVRGRCATITVAQETSTGETFAFEIDSTATADDPADPLELLIRQLSDRELRMIFCGLAGAEVPAEPAMKTNDL